MADDKQNKDWHDRDRVAGNEDYEVRYVADKYKVSADEVRDAIEKVGNNREDLDSISAEGRLTDGSN